MRAKERKRLFVHVGMHKTGTSSIQYMMHTNLVDNAYPDYLFPKTGREGATLTQHAFLAKAFSQPDQTELDILGRVWNREALFSSFLKEMGQFGGSKIAITSEDFCLLTNEQVQAFRACFEDFDIEPIFYIRQLPDYVEKYHQTMVQMDFYSPEQLKNPNFKFWESVHQPNVFEIAKSWAEIAHDKKIWIVDYDAPGPRIDSVALFLEIIGIDPGSIQLVDGWMYGNKSHSPIQTLIKTEMIKAEIAPNHIEGLIRQLSKLDFSENNTILPIEVRARLRNVYEEQFKSLVTAKFVKIAKMVDLGEGGSSVGLKEEPSAFVRREQEPIYIDGLISAVFALGRAVAHTKVERLK